MATARSCGSGRIVKLGEDRYYLPGGGLEAGETPEHCLVREVAEELAHEALIGQPLGRAVQYLESIRFGPIIVEAHYFRVTLGGALAREPEHEALWLPCAEAARLLTREADRWALGTLLGGGD